MNLIFLMILCFLSAGLLVYTVLPFVTAKTADLNKKRADKFATKTIPYLDKGRLVFA